MATDIIFQWAQVPVGMWNLLLSSIWTTHRQCHFSGTMTQRQPRIPDYQNEFAASKMTRRYASILASLESSCLLVQDNTQQGRVDVDAAIILNEAQSLEFVHEKIDPGARGPDHFR
jgi:hypothetical protein